MPKKNSFQKMSKKDIRSQANTFANLHRDQAARMLSMAMHGGEHVFAVSGNIGGPPSSLNPWPKYLEESAALLPWRAYNADPATRALPREHSNCAEAHVWLELMARGKNPKSYTLVSFNADGQIASPCANCAQWVTRAFGDVYKETPAYEGRTRQRPIG